MFEIFRKKRIARYGLRGWSGYCINIDKDIGVTGGHSLRGSY